MANGGALEKLWESENLKPSPIEISQTVSIFGRLQIMNFLSPLFIKCCFGLLQLMLLEAFYFLEKTSESRPLKWMNSEMLAGGNC